MPDPLPKCWVHMELKPCEDCRHERNEHAVKTIVPLTKELLADHNRRCRACPTCVELKELLAKLENEEA